MNNAVKYSLKKSVIAFVLSVLICFPIFIFFIKSNMSAAEFSRDIIITVACTALINAVLQVIITKLTIAKDSAPLAEAQELSITYAFIPKNTAAFIIAFTVIPVFVFSFCPVGMVFTFAPNIVFPRFLYITIKSVLASLSGAFVNYHGGLYLRTLYGQAVSR